jgi:Zn-dependent protease with chaperone function
LVAAMLSLPVLGCASAPSAGSAREEKVEGYLEWRQGSLLVVDGQRLAPGAATQFEGDQEARDAHSIPLGYEVKARGVRSSDGVIQAREIEAKPNGTALFEQDVKRLTDEAEAQYRKAGRFYREGADGEEPKTIGRLEESGPRYDRVRRIVDRLTPPYLRPDDVRVYVIVNEEWNAFAMGNYSIYVFSGLLDAMDDDEVAIVLGHELVHASHEHTRKHFKKAMWIQLAALGLSVAAEEIDNSAQRTIAQLLTQLGALAWSNGYGRDLEDQADRVGLRYAYEAGYDIRKGPALWEKFARRYGDSNRVANFFFSDHSLAVRRAQHLDREIALNYRDGPKPGPPPRRARSRRPPR